MRSRYYSPNLRQFLSADRYMGDLYHPASLNPYSYMEGNPVRYIDPMGYAAVNVMRMDGGFTPIPKDPIGKILWDIRTSEHPVDKALEQMILGNATDEVTLLGTGGQIGMSIFGVDLPADLRDLTYDIRHFECTKEHIFQTTIDAVALLPAIGVIKHSDEVGTLIKNADEIADGMKKSLRQGGELVENLLGKSDEATELAEITKKIQKSKGEFHHIASNRSKVSGFTKKYEEIFKRAGMSLEDEENIMFLENHRGAHTTRYKKYVLVRIDNATKGLSEEEAREALIRELQLLRKELLENPRMPYKGGL